MSIASRIKGWIVSKINNLSLYPAPSEEDFREIARTIDFYFDYRPPMDPLNVRVVDRDGNLIATGILLDCHSYGYPNPLQSRDGIMAIDGGVSFAAPPRVGHCSVRLAQMTDIPLWYGGTYREHTLYFSLPSGLSNVWGQGNDFDTDAYRIHPDDINQIMERFKS